MDKKIRMIQENWANLEEFDSSSHYENMKKQQKYLGELFKKVRELNE